MKIQLVNSTTRLPLDTKLAKIFQRVAKPIIEEMPASCWHRRDHAPDIHLVDPTGLDEHRRMAAGIDDPARWAANESDRPEPGEMPDIDLLGVFVPHDDASHRPIIAMSPEKILRASASLCRLPESTWKLSTAYPAMFCAVAAHELAHAIMAPDRHPDMCHTPWSYLANLFDAEDEKLRTGFEEDTRDIDVPRAAGAKRGGCIWHRKTDDRDPLPRAYDHLVIEESIANAIALRQDFDAEQGDIIRRFVAGQSAPYRAGLKWSGSFGDMVALARSFRTYKRKRRVNRWALQMLALPCRTPLPASTLASTLLVNDGAPVAPVDFESEFLSHLLACLPEWDAELASTPTGTDRHRDLDELLNGTCGVRWTLQLHRRLPPQQGQPA